MFLDWDDLPEILQSVLSIACKYVLIFEYHGFNLIETAPFPHDAGAMFFFKKEGIPQ